jgi:DNA repair exonuclease SbcCD ATPase subunit
MIVFRSCRYQNFLSTGNMWIEVLLDRSPSTMVTGKNGHGKSSVLDAICYALFGKPFRKINKPQLINTKTGKGLLVELRFDINDDEYLIRRGQKPEIFEVIKNGVLLNQPGSSVDFQKQLNLNILKMDYSAFTQIVAVGKAQHVSFMKLDAAKRRQFIETILSLVIFSKMTQLQNAKFAIHKEKMTEIKNAIEVAGEKVEVRKKYITDLEIQLKNAEESSKNERQKEVDELSLEIKQLTNDLMTLQTNGPESPETWKVEDELQEARILQTRFRTKLTDLEQEINDLKENTICQHCDQEIPEAKRTNKCLELEAKGTEQDERIQLLGVKINKLETKLSEYRKLDEIFSQYSSEVVSIADRIQDREKRLKKLIEREGSNNDQLKTDIEKAKEQLLKFIDVYEKLQKKRAVLSHDVEYMGLVGDMLKDSGIKGMLIKRYIPIINHAINNNLTKLGFFGKFTLDEEFDETIHARGFDSMSYNNFSEGEKMRIDMAVLLAWREIAKLQSNVDTNLLMLDEVIDGSLDNEGTEAFGRLLTELKGTNLFIVTHSPEKIADRMRSHIHFEKVGGYSAIKV